MSDYKRVISKLTYGVNEEVREEPEVDAKVEQNEPQDKSQDDKANL